MAKTYEVEIGQLIPDDKNFNKGTDEGKKLIRKSLHDFGAGRSVLIDKDNRIIAGNKTHENADAADIRKVIVVETDGTELVAVKRTDIGIDTKEGRELALADNATAHVNLEWDVETLNEVSENYDIDLNEWGFTEEGKKATELLSELKFNDIYYTPDEKPNLRLKDCIDTDLFEKKKKYIDTLDLKQDVKDAMMMLAYRFLQIDFESVANYYAFNATEDEKRGIERLRCVLVDGGVNGFIEDDLIKVSVDD